MILIYIELHYNNTSYEKNEAEADVKESNTL